MLDKIADFYDQEVERRSTPHIVDRADPDRDHGVVIGGMIIALYLRCSVSST